MFNIQDPATFHTDLEIDGRTVAVTWKSYPDVLIPENKTIFDNWIEKVDPPVDIDDETILRMCDEKEREDES